MERMYCLQQPRIGQVKAVTQDLNLGAQQEWQQPSHLSHLSWLLPRVHMNRKLKL